jgi:hypothetical protein
MPELRMTLYFTNTCILGMMGLKTLSFAKARTLLIIGFHIFSWFLMMLRQTFALQSSIGAFLIHFLSFSFIPTLT